ncbi:MULTISPECIES: hypothetical protein [unclassified Actinotalea]|uniref:hypothetical protein n=1 Tax=unclassified Actinotalea TaxID=2638618 RepID=UPI0015F5EEA5|nr:MULTISPECIES: hypothetical protein [unclassified Actinotalea]
MTLPSPENPQNAPIWDNYVVAQVAQASLGAIPRHALAVGVEIAGKDVTLRFQLARETPDDDEDIEDIKDAFWVLVGNDVNIGVRTDVMSAPELEVRRGVRWIYRARLDD